MIFISYRISDSQDLISRLDADLSREFGRENVYRDTARLQGALDWTKQLEQNARTRRVMLVAIGSTWQSAVFTDGDFKGFPRLSVASDWVRREITLSLDAGNVVIPVFLNGAAMPPEGWLQKCGLEALFKKQGYGCVRAITRTTSKK
jgi:hypothetical protein